MCRPAARALVRVGAVLGLAVLLGLPAAGGVEDCLPLEKAERFVQLSMVDGLPHNVVFAIEQDGYGFVWIATKEGLGRFDGQRFEVWRHDPMDPGSLADDDISSVVEDRYGRLWIGTWGGGLDCLDPGAPGVCRLLRAHAGGAPPSATARAAGCGADSGAVAQAGAACPDQRHRAGDQHGPRAG